MDEKELREQLYRERDDVIVESALPVTPRSLDHIMSVRLPGPLAAALRDVAIEQGTTVSELLRKAAERLVGKPIGWQCEHMNMTSVPGVLVGPVVAWCGCTMEPVYGNRDLRSAPVR